MKNSRSFHFLVVALRIFGASFLLSLSIGMFFGLYAFYGLVLSPEVERKEVAIELYRERELSFIHQGRGWHGNSRQELDQ